MRSSLAGGPSGRPALVVVALLGGGLAAVHLRHLAAMDGLGTLAGVVHVALPLSLSLSLPLLALVAFRSTTPPEHPVLVAWTGVGTLVLGTIGGWASIHVVHHGGVVPHVWALLANAATFGALAGLLVGSYDAQRRASTRRSRNHARRAEEVAEIVSHDLRNTLNVAQGYADLAERSEDVERLAPARRAHERIAAIIDQLLAVTEGRPVRGRRADVPLDAALRDAWAAAGRPGDLEVGVEATVVADPRRLRELFEHLFRYAEVHAQDELAVAAERIDGGLRIAFAQAIPLEVVETSAPRRGGFELYLVAAIAESHGWSVDARDVDGGTALGIRWGREDGECGSAGQ